MTPTHQLLALQSMPVWPASSRRNSQLLKNPRLPKGRRKQCHLHCHQHSNHHLGTIVTFNFLAAVLQRARARARAGFPSTDRSLLDDRFIAEETCHGRQSQSCDATEYFTSVRAPLPQPRLALEKTCSTMGDRSERVTLFSKCFPGASAAPQRGSTVAQTPLPRFPSAGTAHAHAYSGTHHQPRSS